MRAERWHKVEELYHAALERDPTKRAAFLIESCGADPELRGEVESLLAAHDCADDFIETPAAGEIARLLEGGLWRPAAGCEVGRYKVLSPLGEGGMGAVYLAQDSSLGRKVAIKFLSSQFAAEEDRVRRFEIEARAASALNHPNILTIHEIGEAEGQRFIATEFIEGDTLRRRMETRKMSLGEAIETTVQVGNALAAAHAAGIVHRDIKPENIMVRRDGIVKVLDFGIAKLTELQEDESAEGERIGRGRGGEDEPAKRQSLDPRTTTLVNTDIGVVLGTARYMSPEQARGSAVDARTDIWSLGVVLYEMVAGRAPFGGETSSEIISSILERKPPPLTQLALEAPPELERIVGKCLEKDRERRYGSVQELLTDLKALERAAGPGAAVVVRKVPLATRYAVAAVALVVVAAMMVAALFYAPAFRGLPASPAPELRSLAVLPLRSFDGSEAHLGLGIADAVIRRMSQTGKLVVRPTSAVRRYLEEETDALAAARQLNVDVVLDGTFQRAEDRLRVSVNLLRTSDGASLWVDSFDMRSADIFTIQDAVAQQVTARLDLQLDPAQQAGLTKRHTSNPLAYEYYMKGMYSLDQRRFDTDAKPQMEETVRLFERATEADPNYALAHAQLAFSYAWIAVYVEPEQKWVDRAREELDRAEALDAQLAETRVVRHMILYSAYEGFRIGDAIHELLSAQQINPNLGHVELAHLYQHIGLEDLAEQKFRRALEIDPTSEHVKNNIVGDYRIVNKYDEWLAANERFFNGKPTAWYYLGKGRLDEAGDQLEQALAKNPDNTTLRLKKAILLTIKGDFRAAEPEIHLALGKDPVKNLAYHHITYDIACVYALAGRSEDAVKWLRETAATGFPSYPLFEREPFLDRIRQSPDFVRFMAEMRAQFERYKRDFG
ncbi:MAG: protein kinase [Acidobacteriota bacterium]|nr:protein kinase [Acidobacteriota bacterium]